MSETLDGVSTKFFTEISDHFLLLLDRDGYGHDIHNMADEPSTIQQIGRWAEQYDMDAAELETEVKSYFAQVK